VTSSIEKFVTPWARIQVEMASIYCLSCAVGRRDHVKLCEPGAPFRPQEESRDLGWRGAPSWCEAASPPA
jgi:hypothetical protein